jgi:hypothetical protein
MQLKQFCLHIYPAKSDRACINHALIANSSNCLLDPEKILRVELEEEGNRNASLETRFGNR